MPTTPGGRHLGVVFAPPDPRSWPYAHTRSLPVGAPRDIDLRSRMQAVGNQGQLGSCTGWAGTAALEAKLGDGQQRSPLYVYYYDRKEDGTPPNQDSGSTMLGLCKALKDYGAPPEEWWYYNTTAYSSEPSPDARAHATRIDAYYAISGSGLALLQGLWAALDAGEVCPLALNVYMEFERMDRDGKAPMPQAGSTVLGGHAITACGWFNDQSAPGGYGWIMCQNSWGEEFGDRGYVYLPAAYFTSGIVREAWVIAVSAPVPPAPGPEPDVDTTEELRARLSQIQDCVGAAQADRCEWGATKAVYQQSMARICDHDIGPIYDLARECLELLPKVPSPPGPSPSPPTLSGVYGTYSGHGRAQDLYGGQTDDQVQWGPHHGLPLVAPVDGRVELYQLGTPLAAALGAAASGIANTDPEFETYARNFHALFGDWTCQVPHTYGAQVMYVAVFWPSAPLTITGVRVGHLHYGHVRSDVTTGTVQAGQPFATAWDSGIRFENAGITNARASHTHCCAGAGTTLSPNGDLDGRLAITAQGWSVTDLGSVPGPNDYLSGAYCAGRRLGDFTAGGHPIPPMPG